MKQTKPKVHYDNKTDVLWINIKAGAEEIHKEVAEGVSIELGKNGELLGIEILDASKVLGEKLPNRLGTNSRLSAVAHKIR